MTTGLTTSWLSPLGWTLLHFLWQGATLAAGLAALLFLMRRATANGRYLVACVVLLLMAVCPPLTLWVLTTQPAMRAAGATPSPARRFELPVSLSSAEHLNVRTPERPSASPSPARFAQWQRMRRLEPLLPWLVAAWLSGVMLLSLRMLGSWVAVQRLKRRAVRPIPGELPARLAELARRMGIARPVALRESGLVDSPSVVGAVRVVILLPVSALSGLTPAQLEAILVHELAHIRRHDYLVNLLQTALETVLFYHPAVWWVSHCIRLERENCCDDLAVAALGDRICYARALTALEALRSTPRALALAGNGGDLLSRVRRILGRPSPHPGPSAGWLGGVLMTTLLLAATAAFHLAATGSPSLSIAAGPAVSTLSAQATVRKHHARIASGSLQGADTVLSQPVVVPATGEADAGRRASASSDNGSEGSLLVISSSDPAGAGEKPSTSLPVPPPVPRPPASRPKSVVAPTPLTKPAPQPQPTAPLAGPQMPTTLVAPVPSAPVAPPKPPALAVKPALTAPRVKPVAAAPVVKPEPVMPPAATRPPAPAKVMAPALLLQRASHFGEGEPKGRVSTLALRAPSPANARVATKQPPNSGQGGNAMAMLGGLGGGGIVKGGGNKRYQDIAILDLRGVSSRQVSQIERITDVAVVLLDEANRNALRAAVEDVAATVVAKPGMRVMVEPFLEISKSTLEGMPAGQSLLLVGIVVFRPDVPPALVAQKFAVLEVVGVVLSTPQIQGALLGKMQLTGVQANLPTDAGPLYHGVGANTLTQNYLARLPDNIIYIGIGATQVAKDVTEAMLTQKIRAYCNIGATTGPPHLIDVLKARAATNLGVFSADDDGDED